LRAIGPPMLPSPMKPMRMVSPPSRFRPEVRRRAQMMGCRTMC
jgi:hypothetical protein